MFDLLNELPSDDLETRVLHEGHGRLGIEMTEEHRSSKPIIVDIGWIVGRSERRFEVSARP